MLLLKAVPILLTLCRAGAAHFDLSELLQKVIEESDSAAVYFIGIEDSFLTSFMATHADVPVTIFKASPTDYNEDFFRRRAILVVQAIDTGGQCRDELQTFIEHLGSRDFVVVVASELHSLYHSLVFCHENKFKRIFGTLNDSSYAYLPYADRPLQQLSRIREPLPDALRDLNGLAIRTTIQMDFPSCFWYLDSEGRYQVGGYMALTFLQFVRRHNATFKEVLINNSRERNIPGIINATVNGIVDIGMTPYSLQVLDDSRPLKFSGWCIMVPLNTYMPRRESFLKPFFPSVWICIGLAMLYMIAMDFVKDIFIGATPNWWRSFRRTFLVMLSASGVAARTAYRFHVQILLFGFIMCNLYTIYFTSFLTTLIETKPYETIQDLIDNQVRVVIPATELATAQESGNHALDSIALPVDYAMHVRGSRSLKNTSLAYTIGEDYVNFLVQMRGERSRLQIYVLPEKMSWGFKTFIMAKHSPFKTILDVFIEEVHASGLIEKWDRNTRVQAISGGFVNHQLDDLLPEMPTPMDVGDLLVAWVCLLVGLTVATVVFLCEMSMARAIRA